jgi:hypothetical protein
MDTNNGNSNKKRIPITNKLYMVRSRHDIEQAIVEKVCDRVVNTIYNELDYYMFEELGYTETDDRYVRDADKLINRILKELIK